MVTNPPGLLLADLAADLLELQGSISLARSEERRTELTRVSANLSLVMAQVLGYLGQRRESRRWWLAAEHAAERSGSAELAALAFGCEAMQALHEHRPRAVVLRRVDRALEASEERVCAGVLEARAARAQVRSIMGDDVGASADLTFTGSSGTWRAFPTRNGNCPLARAAGHRCGFYTHVVTSNPDLAS